MPKASLKLLATLLALCLATPTHAQSGATAKQPGTWMSQFAAGAPGKDVAIVCDETGVWAWAADWKLPMDKTVATWCVADPYAQVVWMLVGTDLRVLDLAAAPGRTTVVMKRWPTNGDATDGDAAPIGLAIAHGKRRLGNNSYNDAYHVHIDVTDAKVSLGLDNFYYNIDEKELAKIEKGLRLRSRKLVARLAARAAGRTLPPSASSCPKKRSDIPAAACEDDGCGATEPVPGTSYCRVLVERTCGDGCYLGFAFYDSATGAYLYGFKPGGENATIPFSSSSTLHISPSGKLVIAAGAILDWRRPVLPKGAAGWVGISGRLSGD
jgi:hypothetical protein